MEAIQQILKDWILRIAIPTALTALLLAIGRIAYEGWMMLAKGLPLETKYQLIRTALSLSAIGNIALAISLIRVLRTWKRPQAFGVW